MSLSLVLIESFFAFGIILGLGAIFQELTIHPFLVSLTDPGRSTLLFCLILIVWILLLWHGRQRTKGLLNSLPLAFPIFLPLTMVGIWLLEPGDPMVKLAMGIWSMGLCYSFPTRPWDHVMAGLVVFAGLAGVLVGKQDWTLRYLAVTASAWFFVGLVKGTLTQLRLELYHYERARTVAAEFVAANMKLQDMLYREGVNERNAERQRVAREVHDTIGHTLTALLVQISLVRELIGSSDAGIRSRMDTIETMMRTALQDMRMTVSGLRDESLVDEEWHEPIQRLCTLFAQSTGTKITRYLDASIQVALPQVKRLLYRLVQEGITNAYRHGNASSIDVSIGMDPAGQVMVLRISDNGRGGRRIVPGNGMRGMMERLKALEGTLQFQTRPNRGFDLGMTYPIMYNTEEVHHEHDQDHPG